MLVVLAVAGLLAFAIFLPQASTPATMPLASVPSAIPDSSPQSVAFFLSVNHSSNRDIVSFTGSDADISLLVVVPKSVARNASELAGFSGFSSGQIVLEDPAFFFPVSIQAGYAEREFAYPSSSAGVLYVAFPDGVFTDAQVTEIAQVLASDDRVMSLTADEAAVVQAVLVRLLSDEAKPAAYRISALRDYVSGFSKDDLAVSFVVSTETPISAQDVPFFGDYGAKGALLYKVTGPLSDCIDDYCLKISEGESALSDGKTVSSLHLVLNTTGAISSGRGVSGLDSKLVMTLGDQTHKSVTLPLRVVLVPAPFPSSVFYSPDNVAIGHAEAMQRVYAVNNYPAATRIPSYCLLAFLQIPSARELSPAYPQGGYSFTANSKNAGCSFEGYSSKLALGEFFSLPAPINRYDAATSFTDCSSQYCSCDAAAGAVGDLETKFASALRIIRRVPAMRDGYRVAYGTDEYAKATIIRLADLAQGNDYECAIPVDGKIISLKNGGVYFVRLSGSVADSAGVGADAWSLGNRWELVSGQGDTLSDAELFRLLVDR